MNHLRKELDETWATSPQRCAAAIGFCSAVDTKLRRPYGSAGFAPRASERSSAELKARVVAIFALLDSGNAVFEVANVLPAAGAAALIEH